MIQRTEQQVLQTVSYMFFKYKHKATCSFINRNDSIQNFGLWQNSAASACNGAVVSSVIFVCWDIGLASESPVNCGLPAKTTLITQQFSTEIDALLTIVICSDSRSGFKNLLIIINLASSFISEWLMVLIFPWLSRGCSLSLSHTIFGYLILLSLLLSIYEYTTSPLFTQVRGYIWNPYFIVSKEVFKLKYSSPSVLVRIHSGARTINHIAKHHILKR